MWQMVFANVSVKGWIIGPCVQGFFYGPQEVLVLSPQYGKIVNSDFMTRDVMMVIYGRWGLEMFFQPLFKIPSWLTNILIITINPVTLIPVNDPTCFVYWVFVLWGHEVVLDNNIFDRGDWLQLLILLATVQWNFLRYVAAKSKSLITYSLFIACVIE